MSWSFRVARVGGIEVRIHVTFLLLLAWIAFAYWSRGGPAAAARGLIFIGVLFLCVLLHEFGHALAAARYGIKTPDITLLPIGGVARLQRMPDRPIEEFVVAIAGPLVNVVIAAAIFLGLGVAVRLHENVPLDNPNVPVLTRIMWVNVWLVLFNLIPAFPMDGGRVLRALLATRMNYARATQIAARVGQLAAFAFALVGLLYNPFLIFIALFVYIGAAQEAAQTQMREVARHSAAGDAMITDFRVLPATATLGDAADALLATHQREFPVADGAGAIVGLLTRDDLIAGLKQAGAGARVGDAMKPNVRSISSGASLEDAFKIMNENQLPAVMVLDRTGRAVGMVTPENVGELMMIHSALDGRSRPSWAGARTSGAAIVPEPAPVPEPSRPAST
ncbi:MAG TPA: site-2 protease family protein [Tepidisphaeraceae bacterium]|nr:site-2 protease family protein [Tepidisphaeraceae bacterium]